MLGLSMHWLGKVGKAQAEQEEVPCSPELESQKEPCSLGLIITPHPRGLQAQRPLPASGPASEGLSPRSSGGRSSSPNTESTRAGPTCEVLSSPSQRLCE